MQQQLTGSDHGTGLVTRSLVQKLKEPKIFEKPKVIGMKTKMEPKVIGMKTKMEPKDVGMKTKIKSKVIGMKTKA